jgi:DNA-binding PadR family transcriptional regulator
MPTPKLTVQGLAVLAAMMRDPRAEWYGLDLSKRSGLKPGTIYPILARLLDIGWLERHWEDIDPASAGRPKRRLYKLTGVGEAAARWALDQHLVALQGHPAGSVTRRPRPRLA